MRDCRVCGTEASVPTKTGPATCPVCKRAKYLEVKRRYQHSEKGQATARAREEREDVREKRRQFSRSTRGRANQAKYESTEKGKITRQKALNKYRLTEKAKQTAAAQHLRTKNDPRRLEVLKRANEKYSKSAAMKAKRRRSYARRKGALVPDQRVTAEDWLEILKQHKNRCYYCKKRKVLTIDHVIPVSKGGLHVKENLVPACQSCNSKKKDNLILLC